MRRLYRQVYLTIIASLVLVVLAASALWRLAPNPSPSSQAFQMAGEVATGLLPPADEGPIAQQQALERLYQRLKTDLALYDRQGRPVAAVGRRLPAPRGEAGGWLYGSGGPAWSIHLSDGRWIVARPPPWRHHPAAGLLAFLGGIALAVAICAYPLVRGLTRRLERLQAGVESLGAGDLSARVKVEGQDEVAQLAESFNRAAARIEELVRAHKLLLANTSHELRTPLSRIRLGVELLKSTADPKRKTELERDISELDGLIEQILLSSRLDAVQRLDVHEEVDVLALAAEEAARYEDCAVGGEPVMVRGDPGLLRRMLRNLLDNAQRHGKPPIQIDVRRDGPLSAIMVTDQGPGIPTSEAERIFTPFYGRTGGSGMSGAGLGLTLVRQIARQHGGSAAWAGTPSRPATIRVTLPVSGSAERRDQA